jgi:alpha-1,2-glucosyltransferase
MYIIHSIIVWQQQQQAQQGGDDSISAAPGSQQLQLDPGRAQGSKSGRQSQPKALKGLRLGRGSQGSIRPVLWALCLCLVPPHWSYTYLYYTDIGSTLFILLCYLEAHQGHTLQSALAAVAAILFRQTNAVWVGFTAGSVALQHVQHRVQARIAKLRRKQQEKQQQLLQRITDVSTDTQLQEGSTSASRAHKAGPSLQQQQPLHLETREELSQTLHVIWQERTHLAWQLWPLLCVVLAFAGFVYINKGITVGDRAAHQPVLHAAQFLVYFPLFTAAMLGPQLLDVVMRSMASLARQPRACMVVAVAGTVAGVAGLILSPPPHPYLLADNRHLTFYLWRRVLARSKALTYGVVAPVAGGLAWPLILWALLRRQHWLWVAGYLVCSAAVLVPAWLLEFR